MQGNSIDTHESSSSSGAVGSETVAVAAREASCSPAHQRRRSPWCRVTHPLRRHSTSVASAPASAPP